MHPLEAYADKNKAISYARSLRWCRGQVALLAFGSVLTFVGWASFLADMTDPGISYPWYYYIVWAIFALPVGWKTVQIARNLANVLTPFEDTYALDATDAPKTAARADMDASVQRFDDVVERKQKKPEIVEATVAKRDPDWIDEGEALA